MRLNRRSGIYAIVNSTNGHRYVGSTKNIYKRWREHVRHLTLGRHHCSHLQRAWNKCGTQAFVFCVLAFVEAYDLSATEGSLLTRVVDHKTCYNSGTTPDKPMLGRQHTDSARARMSAWRKGRKFSSEHRANLSASLTGRTRSPEHQANLLARMRSADVIAKKRAAHCGSKRSVESRGRMSASGRLKSNSPRYLFGGDNLTLSQWAQRLGVNVWALRSRVKYGWSVERMLTTPVRSRKVA